MKHNYRDSKGRFAKASSNVVTCSKPYPCVICDTSEKIKKIHPIPEVNEFLEKEPHNGKPVFMKFDNNTQCHIRLLDGNVIPYQKHFVNVAPVQSYMVNVIDLNDGRVKVLDCGKQILKKIYDEIQYSKPPVLTTKQKIKKWIDLKILRKNQRKQH